MAIVSLSRLIFFDTTGCLNEQELSEFRLGRLDDEWNKPKKIKNNLLENFTEVNIKICLTYYYTKASSYW